MSVTAGALRKFLEGVAEDSVVVVASDAEGNSFSPLGGVEDEVRYREPACRGDRGAVMVEVDGEYVDTVHMRSAKPGEETRAAIILWPDH